MHCPMQGFCQMLGRVNKLTYRKEVSSPEDSPRGPLRTGREPLIV